MHTVHFPFRTALSSISWLALVTTAQAAESRHNQNFILLNATTSQIAELYVSPAVSPSEFTEDWGVNLIGAEALQSQDSRRFTPTGNGTSCEYDVHIVYSGEVSEGFDDMFEIDLCENDTIYVDDFTLDWDLIWNSYPAEGPTKQFEV